MADRRNDQRPSILLLISDDQGYGDMSCYDGAPDARTPNMDRIAATGVRFLQGYVTSPICSPSRTAILFGRHQARFGTLWFSDGRFPSDTDPTLAGALREQGYATGYIGKVHYCADFKEPGHAGFPLQHGFESFYGYCHHTIDYLKHKQADVDEVGADNAAIVGVGPMWNGAVKRDATGYSTDLFGEAAVEFIRSHRDRPFFLQVAFNAVHNFVHQLPEAYIRQYNLETVEDWQPEKEGYLDWYRRVLRCDTWLHEDPEYRRLYLACLDLLDIQVGRILDTLEELGLRENTLVIYLSDNGGSPRTCACNAPLSGTKYTLSEGGVRVPFLMSWPARIPNGRVIDETVSALDIYPSALAAATGQADAAPGSDGINLLPLLSGKERSAGHEALFWDSGWEWAVRVGDWKLWVTEQDRIVNLQPVRVDRRLYNIDRDPSEAENLIERMPGRAAELERAHRQWRAERGI